MDRTERKMRVAKTLPQENNPGAQDQGGRVQSCGCWAEAAMLWLGVYRVACVCPPGTCRLPYPPSIWWAEQGCLGRWQAELWGCGQGESAGKCCRSRGRGLASWRVGGEASSGEAESLEGSMEQRVGGRGSRTGDQEQSKGHLRSPNMNQRGVHSPRPGPCSQFCPLSCGLRNTMAKMH